MTLDNVHDPPHHFNDPSPTSALPLRSSSLCSDIPGLDKQQLQQQQQQHHQHSFPIDDNAMSPMIKLRRDSAEDSYHPPAEAPWNGFNFNAPVTTSMNHTTPQAAFIQRNHPGLELNTSHAMNYSQHAQWPTSPTSDNFSPATGIEHIPDFNNPFAMNQVGNQVGYQVNSVLVSPGPMRHGTFPTSPPFSTSSSDGHDARNNSTAGRAQSPPFSSSVANLLRRDGIRKKNARFDIPAERNLKTIDQLIHATNDEQELKELKQQKRLLRNRQAALDSRQRKKQHTERLEEEKKHFSAAMTDLEDALQEYKQREGEWIRKEEQWAATQQHYMTHFENLRIQQEDLVHQHTLELVDLRRKNAMLMEQIQHAESTSMSNVSSSHGVSTNHADYDHMNISSWDGHLSVAHEFTIENNPADAQVEPLKSTEAEKPAASALLLMLLLCGAWVASRNNAVGGSGVLPAIPDDMRAASATILDNLYKDSGVDLDGVVASGKTAESNTSPTTVLGALESAGPFTSNLENLHQRLVAPSAQQLKDQAFGLTPSQYYGMTNTDARYQQAYYDYQQNSKIASGGAVQQDNPSTAESYTRSLLRDKVSTQVLKDFARMVAQSSNDTPVVWKTENM